MDNKSNLGVITLFLLLCGQRQCSALRSAALDAEIAATTAAVDALVIEIAETLAGVEDLLAEAEAVIAAAELALANNTDK